MVEQELLTLPGKLCSLRDFCEIRVAQYPSDDCTSVKRSNKFLVVDTEFFLFVYTIITVSLRVFILLILSDCDIKNKA
jgi:hypothetical protein